MCGISRGRGEVGQKHKLVREEEYLYLMLISDDGRVTFTTQEGSSVILYIIYGMQFEIADQYSEIHHTCSYTNPYVLQMPPYCIEYIYSIYTHI